jgi:hypothetical protein
LENWRYVAWRTAGIHGVIALTYLLWPKKAPETRPGAADLTKR